MTRAQTLADQMRQTASGDAFDTDGQRAVVWAWAERVDALAAEIDEALRAEVARLTTERDASAAEAAALRQAAEPLAGLRDFGGHELCPVCQEYSHERFAALRHALDLPATAHRRLAAAGHALCEAFAAFRDAPLHDEAAQARAWDALERADDALTQARAAVSGGEVR